MSRIFCEPVKKDDRIFFKDDSKYILFDTGFFGSPGCNSAASDGTIGPFKVNSMPQHFFDGFINMKMDDGEKVSAVFNPMDGYNCLLAPNTLMISDEDEEILDYKYFFPFIDPFLPIIRGKLNGEEGRIFFDSGARHTMFTEPRFATEKVGCYTEWMAMKHTYSELDTYKVVFENSDNTLKYEGTGAFVDDISYRMMSRQMNIMAMMGIDIFKRYQLFIVAKGQKRGLYLLDI
ncbi:MAG: hypothetical protein IKB99_00105 [Lentisphaeria bacterium]|nr:hypothetical protein [Lentisphaeria bacterium]